MKTSKKPVTLAVCSALAGGLMLSGSAFASTQLAQGYLLGAQATTPTEKPMEGSCGANKDKMKMASGATDKAKEGSCGDKKMMKEATCGMSAMDSNKDGMISRAEHAAAAQARFDKADANKDGMVSADEMKAMREGKCGDKKAGMEGKCGEGKCGDSK